MNYGVMRENYCQGRDNCNPTLREIKEAQVYEKGLQQAQEQTTTEQSGLVQNILYWFYHPFNE